MKDIINPAFNLALNQHREEFNVAVRVPMLPPPSEKYAHHLLHLITDACFYRCTVIDDKWTWEKVSYGIHRQYVLAISFVTPTLVVTDYDLVDKSVTPTPSASIKYFVEKDGEKVLADADGYITSFVEGTDYYTIANQIRQYVFDDIVYTTNKIIAELSRYDVVFKRLENATMIEAIGAINEIIKHVNRVCVADLVAIPAVYDKVVYEAPEEGRVYYTTEDGRSFVEVGELDAFEDGVVYYEASNDATQATMEQLASYLNPLVAALNPHAEAEAKLADAVARVTAAADQVEGAASVESVNKVIADLQQYITDTGVIINNINAAIADKANATDLAAAVQNVKALSTSLNYLTSQVTQLTADLATKASAADLTNLTDSVSDLVAAQASMGSTIASMTAAITSAETSAAGAMAKANTAVATANSNADAIAKLMAFVESVKALQTSDDMSATEIADVVRGIVAAANDALDTEPEQPAE